MEDITQKQYDELDFIRVEHYRNFIYALAKLQVDGSKEIVYATISKYRSGSFNMIFIGNINEQIPINQSFMDFVNDHALIHITAKKYIWRWRD